MTGYRRTEPGAPVWAPVPSNQLETTLQRLHRQLSEAEEELIRVTERGQKLAAIHGQAIGATEADLDRRYNVSGGEGL